MDVKEYLSKLDNIDTRIKDKISEANKWHEIAKNTSAPVLKERVQTSKKYDKQGDAIALALDFELESRELAIQLANLKHTITKQIDGVNNELYYNILKQYYVYENKSFTDIGRKIGYGAKQTSRYYKKALQFFAEKYGYV